MDEEDKAQQELPVKAKEEPLETQASFGSPDCNIALEYSGTSTSNQAKSEPGQPELTKALSWS